MHQKSPLCGLFCFMFKWLASEPRLYFCREVVYVQKGPITAPAALSRVRLFAFNNSE